MTTTNTRRSALPWATGASQPAENSAADSEVVAMENGGTHVVAEGAAPTKAGSRAAARRERKALAARERAEQAAGDDSRRWFHDRDWKFASKLGFYDPAAPGILSSTRQ